MEGSAQQTVPASIKKSLATPVAPLRSIDLAETNDGPDSGKMVSLADLHVKTQIPELPKGIGMPPGIDPLDPLLQILVQDRLFIAAVQTRQLHAAAASAVNLLRTQFSQQQQSRPAAGDKHHRATGGDYHGHHLQAAAGGSGPQRYVGSGVIGPSMQGVKQQILQLEDSIPWTLVRRTWRNRRPSWRRQIKNTEVVADLAARLKELRAALLTEEPSTSPFIGCGPTWRSQLDACVHGRGSAALLMTVWEELRVAVKGWMEGRSAISPAGSAQIQANAVRAVQAMHAAVRHGGPEHLFQTPLESIVGNDSQGLHAVRQAIELERRIVSARLMALNGSDAGAESQFAKAPWEDDGFDSGAESEGDSVVTDLNKDWDE